MNEYRETVEKGMKSLEALLKQLDDVVDAMQRNDVPVYEIEEYIRSHINVTLVKARMLQNARKCSQHSQGDTIIKRRSCYED